jgi:hypothetical protein
VLLASLAAGCRGLAGHTPTPAAATASATATTTLTALPAHTESTAPTSGPTLQPQPCEHPYLPARGGASWSYAVSGGPAGDFEVTEQVTAVRASGFTLTSRIAGQTFPHTWACDQEGLTAQQFDGMAAAGIALAGGQITLVTDTVEGVSLPAGLAPGARWQQQYTISGSQAFPGLGTLPVRGTVTVDYTALAIEAVTVPFGSFQALHIHSESVYDVRVGSGLLSFSPELFGSSEIYLVENLGMVRVEIDFSLMGDQQHTVVALTSYSFR